MRKMTLRYPGPETGTDGSGVYEVEGFDRDFGTATHIALITAFGCDETWAIDGKEGADSLMAHYERLQQWMLNSWDAEEETQGEGVGAEVVWQSLPNAKLIGVFVRS